MKIGLQLYSVRDKMGEDFEGTLKAVADIGYDCVEFAGYYDKTAEEIREILDKYGLEAVSVHQKESFFIEKGEEAVEFIKTLGVKYMTVPWMGVEGHKGGEEFPKTVENLKTVSKMLGERGIALAYHNHWQEFNLYDGAPRMDWLLKTLDKDTLKAEFDVGWVKYAGYDPCEYLEKYAGRCPIIHLKDFVLKYEGTAPDDRRLMDGRAIGSGCQNIPEILKAAEKAGTEIAIVEDEAGNMDSLEMVKASRDYLKSIGY